MKKFFKALYEAIVAARMSQAESIIKGRRGS
jgi:hypothetical protein